MSRKKDVDCVTRLECTTVSSEIKRDLSAIKIALIGVDMQGGIVNKVNEIQSKVVELALNERNREKSNNNRREQDKAKIEAWSREKVALIGVAGGLIGLVVGQLLNFLFGI